jgi:hypothetical protein
MKMNEEYSHTYIAETPLLVGDSCESKDPSLWVAIAGKYEEIVLSIEETTDNNCEFEEEAMQ